jgi:hypothetical protein
LSTIFKTNAGTNAFKATSGLPMPESCPLRIRKTITIRIPGKMVCITRILDRNSSPNTRGIIKGERITIKKEIAIPRTREILSKRAVLRFVASRSVEFAERLITTILMARGTCQSNSATETPSE